MSAAPLAGHEMFQTAGLRAVFTALETAGGEARIVGGAVRNALFGEPVSDIDIATTLLPDGVMDAAKAAGLTAHPTGVDHGTVTLVADGQAYEVTTLRQDVETDGRHATVAFSRDWMEDARRRDLTINALYASLDGTVHDPLGCIDDIHTRTLRFVGDADARIQEDYLRVLRFFRFFAQYGQGMPDAAGLAACKRHAGALDKLSRERVGQEMRKLLLASGASVAMELMNDAGVTQALIGQAADARLLARVGAVDNAQELVPDLAIRLAASFDLRAEELAGLLRLSNREQSELSDLHNAMPPTPSLREAERKIVLYQTGVETFARAVRLNWARSDAGVDDESWQSLLALPTDWPVPELPVSGADVIAAGVAEGPLVGEALRRLEDWWVASQFSATREELLAKLSA